MSRVISFPTGEVPSAESRMYVVVDEVAALEPLPLSGEVGTIIWLKSGKKLFVELWKPREIAKQLWESQ